jgi:hypothetical protein
MRHILSTLGLVGLSAVIYAADFPVNVVGSYQLIPDLGIRTFCERHNLAVPIGRLILRSDGTFNLTVTDEEGAYTEPWVAMT